MDKGQNVKIANPLEDDLDYRVV